MNLNTTLNDYKNRGLLYSQVHPHLDLTIWNYTDKVQYEGLWDDITMMCRGLVTNSEGEVVARPFKKFFNLSEGRTKITSEYEIHEKLDGSLIILFYYKNQWVVASRGSFTSDQAIWASEILGEKDLKYLGTELTYCLELIHPQNPIVVNYNNRKDLVLTGVFQTSTGEEVDFCYLWSCSIFNLPKIYPSATPLEELHKNISPNEEGYVVRFSNGERVKIKGEEYLRLHRTVTSVSTKSVWKCLKNGEDLLDLLKDYPDEFYGKVEDYVNHLTKTFYLFKFKMQIMYLSLLEELGDPTTKEFALRVLGDKETKKYSTFLFALNGDRDIDELCWDHIKPEFKKL